MYGKWLFRLIVLAVLVGIPLAIFSGTIKRQWLARSFPEERLREYQKLFTGTVRGQVRPGGAPYRTGKVIVIRPSTHSIYISGAIPSTRFWTQIDPSQRRKIKEQKDPPRIDDSWYQLSSSVRAGSPDEVDTVIFCEAQTTKVGTYTDDPHKPGGIYAAYRMDYTLKVYDWKTRSFIGQHIIEGDAPPDETTVLGSHTGEVPEIISVIENMPLRSSAE